MQVRRGAGVQASRIFHVRVAVVSHSADHSVSRSYPYPPALTGAGGFPLQSRLPWQRPSPRLPPFCSEPRQTRRPFSTGMTYKRSPHPLRPLRQLQGPGSTGWTLSLSKNRGWGRCEGRGAIGVRFDRLNELMDRKVPEPVEGSKGFRSGERGIEARESLRIVFLHSFLSIHPQTAHLLWFAMRRDRGGAGRTDCDARDRKV